MIDSWSIRERSIEEKSNMAERERVFIEVTQITMANMQRKNTNLAQIYLDSKSERMTEVDPNQRDDHLSVHLQYGRRGDDGQSDSKYSTELDNHWTREDVYKRSILGWK